MELELIRRCFENGSNGSLFCGDTFICHTIELPWKDNHRSSSCIPEGRYPLVKRYSPKFKWHLLVKDVPGRSVILIHPANDRGELNRPANLDLHKESCYLCVCNCRDQLDTILNEVPQEWQMNEQAYRDNLSEKVLSDAWFENCWIEYLSFIGQFSEG